VSAVDLSAETIACTAATGAQARHSSLPAAEKSAARDLVVGDDAVSRTLFAHWARELGAAARGAGMIGEALTDRRLPSAAGARAAEGAARAAAGMCASPHGLVGLLFLSCLAREDGALAESCVAELEAVARQGTESRSASSTESDAWDVEAVLGANHARYAADRKLPSRMRECALDYSLWLPAGTRTSRRFVQAAEESLSARVFRHSGSDEVTEWLRLKSERGARAFPSPQTSARHIVLAVVARLALPWVQAFSRRRSTLSHFHTLGSGGGGNGRCYMMRQRIFAPLIHGEAYTALALPCGDACSMEAVFVRPRLCSDAGAGALEPDADGGGVGALVAALREVGAAGVGAAPDRTDEIREVAVSVPRFTLSVAACEPLAGAMGQLAGLGRGLGAALSGGGGEEGAVMHRMFVVCDERGVGSGSEHHPEETRRQALQGVAREGENLEIPGIGLRGGGPCMVSWTEGLEDEGRRRAGEVYF